MSLLLLLRETRGGGLPGFAKQYLLHITNDGETLTNYQLKLSLTSANFDFSAAKSDGSDLRITAHDKTTLFDHYVSSWDSDAESAVVWVKIPTVPTSTSAVYLFVGNASATSTAKTFDQFFSKFTSDSDTLALWHCDAGSGSTATDSSGNGNTLTLTDVTWGTGDGGGQDDTQHTFSTGSYLIFNGTSSAAQAPAGFFDTPPQQFSIEFWVRLDAAITVEEILVLKSSAVGEFFQLSLPTTGALKLNWRAYGFVYTLSSSVLTWTVGTWYHIGITAGNGGVRVYRNGVLQIHEDSYAVLQPNTGGGARFTFGTNSALNANFLHGALDEIRILKRELSPAEILNDAQRTPHFTTPMDQAGKFVRHGTVLSPVSGWETAKGSVTAEPTVVYVDGTFHLFYHSGGTTAPTSGIGHATSTDGVTFTRTQSDPVLGVGGFGGEDNAQHAQAFWDGTQFVMAYANTSEAANQGGGLCIATSPDGDTWTPYEGNPVMPMVVDTWESTLGNIWMFQRGDTWYLLYSAKDPSISEWRTGLATAPDYLGPWTKYANNPLTVTGLGSPDEGGRPSLGHPSGPANTTPAWGWWSIGTPTHNGIQIIAGTSDDIINWVGSVSVMAPQNASTEQQGVHDPYIIEANGKVYLYWSEALSSSASIGAATFDGTLAELVTDLSAPTLTL